MSATSRRTTRATSKAASSRGASPAIDEHDIPASPSSRLSSSRRASSKAPLPQVGLRTSNSYGTNQITQSAALKAPELGEKISNTLGNILDPVLEDDDDDDDDDDEVEHPRVFSKVS